MRIAVLSDVHGNLHALTAVLAAAAVEQVDELWCLGDLVGYGVRPNECCALVAERAAVSLAGNHDLGVLGTIPIADFSPEAAASALWTREALAPDPRSFLESLAPAGTARDVQLFHASPRDPVWEYVLDADAIRAALADTAAPVVLIGHSHVALAAAEAGGAVHAGAAPAGTEIDLGAGRTLLNPGSVGQPRDGDPRAAWLLLDLEARTASFRRTEYAVERTQREIREAGLPDVLAERLAHGT